MDATKVHERAVGSQSETGATAGSSHHDVLIQTLGRERGLDVATRGGPPAVRRPKQSP